MIKKIKKYSLVGLSVFGLVFMPWHSAQAFAITSVAGTVLLKILSWLIYWPFIWLMGVLASTMSKLVVWAAMLTGFTTLTVVRESWGVLRDISNMFFIVIMLVIAFGTLFKIEAYSWKKLLPKMILAAVLVNYSQAICGAIVDAAQVVQLTFANAIKDAADVGFVQAFGLYKILSLRDSVADPNAIDSVANQFSDKQGFLGLAAAGLMLCVLVFVQAVYLVVLIARLVFIWFLTILSPIAFTCMILPATEKYYKQWWDMFSRYVTVGPLIVFFLWLSLFVAAKTASLEQQSELLSTDMAENFESNTALANAMQPSMIAGFLISTMMLLAGLKIAQDSSSEIGSAVGKALNFGKMIAFGGLLALAWKGARVPTNAGVDWLQNKTGVDVNMSRQWEKMQARRKRIKETKFSEGYSKASKRAKQGKLLGAFGALGYTYEHHLPGFGRSGLSGMVKKRLESFRGVHDKTVHDTEHQFDKVADLQTKYTKAKEQKGNQVMTAEQKIEEEQDLKNQQAEWDSRKANPDWQAGKNWDMSDAMNTGLLEQHKEKQEEELEKITNKEQFEAGDADKIRNIKSELAEIDRLLTPTTKTGEMDTKATLSAELAANITGHGGFIEAGDKQFEDERARLRDAITTTPDKDGKPVNINTGNLQQAIELETRVQKNELDKEIAVLEDMRKKLAKVTPALDDEAIDEEHHIIGERTKGIQGNDNEDFLIDLLRSQITGNDGMGALATMDHMAKVGHANEIMNAFSHKGFADDGHGNVRILDDEEFSNMSKEDQDKHRITADSRGLKAIQSMMEKNLHLDKELTMSVMNNVSMNAKRNNHWAYAEAVKSVGGELVWRSDEERETRRYGEASKVGANNIARNANRLGYGSYGPGGNYQLDGGVATLIAKNMHQFGDLIQKNLFNTNAAENIFSRKEIEQQFVKLIKSQYIGREREYRMAMRNFNTLRKVVQGGGRGYNPDVIVADARELLGHH
ncbi:MAG: hypothetical protein WC801_01680 [Patescibacteria group bacterium]